MKNARKKSIAVLAGLVVAGVVGASAASLGTIGSADLGSSTEVVGSCDTDGVDVTYNTSFDGTTVTVDSIDVTGVAAACDGQDYEISLTDGTAVLGTSDAGAADSSGGFTATFTASIDAELVDGIAITISG